MRTVGIVLVLGGVVAASCALPEVVYDPAAGTGGTAGATGGGAGTGGTSGTGGTDGGGEGGAGTCTVTTEREDLCGQYCVTYLEECGTHEANTYEDVLDCAHTCACAPWPLGTITEPGSVECRRYHSTLAASSGVNPHCYHSAEVPTMGACEVVVPTCEATTERQDLCDQYCEGYLAECATHEANTYDTVDDCRGTCNCASWPIGTITEPGSLECRRYHSTLAASSGVNPHCFHSSEFPTMGACECVDTAERQDLCDQYCEVYLAECSMHEANTYESEPDCKTTCMCAPWPIGTITEPGSLECRRYHSTLAASSGVNPHCFHSSEFPTMGACEVVSN